MPNRDPGEYKNRTLLEWIGVGGSLITFSIAVWIISQNCMKFAGY